MRNFKNCKPYEQTLLKMHKSLCKVALNRDIAVSIELRFDNDISLNIVFFKDGENFSFSMYQFYSEEKNKKIFNLSKKLIKDKSLFEEYLKIKTYEDF